MSGLYDNYSAGYSAPYDMDNIFNDYDYGQETGGNTFNFGNTQPQNGYQNFGSLMGGIGGLAQGTAGLYGMYLGNRQLKDQEKNNSLYRRLAQEQQTNHNQFVGSVHSAFA